MVISILGRSKRESILGNQGPFIHILLKYEIVYVCDYQHTMTTGDSITIQALGNFSCDRSTILYGRKMNKLANLGYRELHRVNHRTMCPF